MMMIYYTSYPSAVGVLHIAASAEGLQRILLPKTQVLDAGQFFTQQFPHAELREAAGHEPASAICVQAVTELREYFDRQRRVFTCPLVLHGTPFQQKVWEIVKSIPYGETCTYGDIAKQLGDSKSSRAVGLANGANPIPIIIPCHRVIGKNGSLTGYGGGLAMKQHLLSLEGVNLL